MRQGKAKRLAKKPVQRDDRNDSDNEEEENPGQQDYLAGRDILILDNLA